MSTLIDYLGLVKAGTRRWLNYNLILIYFFFPYFYFIFQINQWASMLSLPSSHAIFDTVSIKFLNILRLFLVFASVNEPPISLTRGSQTQWRFNDGFHFLSTIKACLVILKYNICMIWMRIFWWKYAHVYTRKYTTSWDIQPAFLGYECCHILQKISLYTSKSDILEEFSNSWRESRSFWLYSHCCRRALCLKKTER